MRTRQSTHRAKMFISALCGAILLSCACADDWPQYRGPAGNGISTEQIANTWNTNSPGFVVWTNRTLTNGFSSFAVSQGRAFAQCSRMLGGSRRELCAAIDAATGTNIWATVIGDAQWDPNDSSGLDGGAGTSPCNKGNGPRSTPAAADGRVLALSGQMNLVCLNATNGSVLWSNNLVSAYGASVISWDNGASPRVEGGLIYVNLNSSTDGQTLTAFRVSDGSMAWSTQTDGMTHNTPTLATIESVRQVIFATQTRLVSLNSTNGALLWSFPYPFATYPTTIGASPVVYSNIVYCTAAYNRGAAAARVTRSGSTWTATQLYYRTGANYRSVWMTPVCYEGYIYALCGDSTTFLTTPLACIELSTGTVRWTTNRFGLGGIILVNTNLLVLTEDGQLVLVRPNPTAYTELARYRAFQFTTSAPGKCWNSPAYSDGRIYARSTRDAVSLNVAPPVPPQLKILSAQFLDRAHLQLVVGTTNGAPIDTARLARLEVRATNALGAPPNTWPLLNDALTLATNGAVWLTNAVGDEFRRFYIISEPP